MSVIGDARLLLDSLYDNGDLSVDQHAGIYAGLQQAGAELVLLRELRADVARYLNRGGEVADLRYIVDTMGKLRSQFPEKEEFE